MYRTPDSRKQIVALYRVRELVDGAAGLRDGGDHLAHGDSAWWAGCRSRLERTAKEAERGA
ncbi:hypothetical protein ACFOZ0_11650 [Streptomyces yaanensis]|uniref:Uncharacterized protein n=1 Tax=Streptomyces yaanensis TaxID=1142239 RepID=A0ABV7SAL0_9ACTN|nr:hypothetical protein [Streptomyces sp. CGMCC 4.7035]WNB99215.1 hypothetical protein Q2K21_14645 [Streptomyces sp. CGMCC 4.7035]